MIKRLIPDKRIAKLKRKKTIADKFKTRVNSASNLQDIKDLLLNLGEIVIGEHVNE